MTCQKCGNAEGDHLWVGDGGAIGYVHGAYQHWCRLCVITAQLAHCRDAARLIPVLECELAELRAKELPQ